MVIKAKQNIINVKTQEGDLTPKIEDEERFAGDHKTM